MVDANGFSIISTVMIQLDLDIISTDSGSVSSGYDEIGGVGHRLIVVAFELDDMQNFIQRPQVLLNVESLVAPCSFEGAVEGGGVGQVGDQGGVFSSPCIFVVVEGERASGNSRQYS